MTNHITNIISIFAFWCFFISRFELLKLCRTEILLIPRNRAHIAYEELSKDNRVHPAYITRYLKLRKYSWPSVVAHYPFLTNDEQTQYSSYLSRKNGYVDFISDKIDDNAFATMYVPTAVFELAVLHCMCKDPLVRSLSRLKQIPFETGKITFHKICRVILKIFNISTSVYICFLRN